MWNPFSTPLSRLRNQARDIGNPRYPFLHRELSPSSRVPCTDLTPFITERLLANDIRSIRGLMREVISANPGLGVGVDWIDSEVDRARHIPFANYVAFGKDRAETELRALFIVSSKDGSGSEFWLTKDKPLLFAFALCAYRPAWKEPMAALADKANRFIRKMRKDTDYWRDYPFFDADSWRLTATPKTELEDIIVGLTPGSRMQLFAFCEQGGTGNLNSTWSQELRYLGIHADAVADELLQTGFFVSSHNPEALLGVWGKNDLVRICSERGVAYRKSWNKARLLQVLRQAMPAFLDEEVARHKIVELNPDVVSPIRSLLEYACKLRKPMELLCFS